MKPRDPLADAALHLGVRIRRRRGPLLKSVPKRLPMFLRRQAN